MDRTDILNAFERELEKAVKVFPWWPVDPVHAASILNEEAGELIRAVLQYTYEGGSKNEIRAEAIQVGAMIIRFLVHLEEYEIVRPKQVP